MDLNVMMREQAAAGLQTALDKAVTDGDTVAARKISDDLAKLAVSAAPKAPPFTGDDVKTELSKLDWFGVDPKKSAKAIEFGKTMDLKKFASADLMAAAIVKAVDVEFPAPKTEDEEDADTETGQGADVTGEPKPKRKTDGPGERDAGTGTGTRRTAGPWTKLADAPADVQKEIRRAVDKFVSNKAPKEQREGYITRALESHYAQHQRKAGKK